MDNPGSSPSRGGYRATATVLFTLVIVYFLFPFAYIWPLLMIYGRHGPPPPAFQAFFAPLIYLSDHVPVYHALIEKEFEWMERVGLR